MSILFTHIRKLTAWRRFHAALVVVMLCLAWVAPAQGLCPCCVAMATDTVPVAADESGAENMPECHQHVAEAVSLESAVDPALPNPIQFGAQCEDKCSLEQDTTDHAIEPTAEIVNSIRLIAPVLADAKISPVVLYGGVLNREAAPPGLRSLSTVRYSASLPLLT